MIFKLCSFFCIFDRDLLYSTKVEVLIIQEKLKDDQIILDSFYLRVVLFQFSFFTIFILDQFVVLLGLDGWVLLDSHNDEILGTYEEGKVR